MYKFRKDASGCALVSASGKAGPHAVPLERNVMEG
jgi:hypothetical protein